MDIKKAAEKLFNSTKKRLADARKNNKENKGVWNRMSQMTDYSIWERTAKGEKTYVIKMFDTDIVTDIKYKWDVENIFKEFGKLLDAQKNVKGWGGLSYTKKKYSFSYNWGDSVDFIDKVSLADAVCKEYKSLMNYINKFGVSKYGGKVNLGEYRLFSAAMGGKRGVLWDEYGERMFLDNAPKKCQRILDTLRGKRGTKDKMLCTFGSENYIDETDRRYSEYHEVECEGEKRSYMLIEISTPSGKVKYTDKIY